MKNFFQRYEFKYLIPDALIPLVRSELLHRDFEYDSFANKQHNYIVDSLYFDSNSHLAFHTKLAGIQRRYKLRLRTYRGQSESAPMFAEIKNKFGSIIQKQRTELSQHSVNYILGNETSCPDAAHDKSLELFITRMKKNNMRPKVIVSYTREPLHWIYNHRLRITFDANLSFERARQHEFQTPSATTPLIPGHTILELKCDGSIPAWFSQIIAQFQLQHISVSKYCTGLIHAAKYGNIPILRT